MRKERERRTLETAGMLFTLLFGNLLHFVYDWTGQAGWAAYLSAVNESTWEHMKLLAVPWLVWTVVTIVVNRCAASALPRAIGLLAGLAAIPALFYTYTGILGKSIDVVNILIFQAAVLLAYFVSASLQKSARLSSVPFQILGILLHLLAALAFLFSRPFPRPFPCLWTPQTGPAAYHQKRCDTNGLQLKESGASHNGKRRFFCGNLPLDKRTAVDIISL